MYSWNIVLKDGKNKTCEDIMYKKEEATEKKPSVIKLGLSMKGR